MLTILKFLSETDFTDMELGRYELNARSFYVVQEYETKPKPLTESHSVGEFMVLHPSDIHVSGTTLGESVKCHKVVAKVKV